MKLGLMAGYSGARLALPVESVLEAERLGFDSVWTAEAYGSDAVTTATWLLARTSRIAVGTAIMQMPARTPACTAMTAMSLDHLSGGRFRLGIGPSGPQVVEGWHGVPYGKPITRTKEYVSILRAILAREAPVVHEGPHYQIPYRGEDATGLGKPLKSILHGRADLPVYTAAITPAGIRCSAEVADGLFPLWLSPERFDVIAPHLEQGFGKAGGGKSLDGFEIAPFVAVSMGDDLARCRAPIRASMALYIGGMGARTKNFYNDWCKRMGFETAAAQIQDLFLGGKKEAAAAAVPDELVDAVNLVGSPDRIRERLGAWKDAAARGEVDTLLLSGDIRPQTLKVIAEAVA